MADPANGEGIQRMEVMLRRSGMTASERSLLTAALRPDLLKHLQSPICNLQSAISNLALACDTDRLRYSKFHDYHDLLHHDQAEEKIWRSSAATARVGLLLQSIALLFSSVGQYDWSTSQWFYPSVGHSTVQTSHHCLLLPEFFPISNSLTTRRLNRLSWLSLYVHGRALCNTEKMRLVS